MTQQTLKPCPFCGGEATVVQSVEAEKDLSVDVFVGQCEDCLAQGPGGETETEALDLWNKRT